MFVIKVCGVNEHGEIVTLCSYFNGWQVCRQMANVQAIRNGAVLEKNVCRRAQSGGQNFRATVLGPASRFDAFLSRQTTRVLKFTYLRTI